MITQLQKLRRHEITNATLTVKHETLVNWTNWIGGETVTTSHTYKPGDVVWLHTWRPEGMMIQADGAPEMFVMWKYISQMFGEEI
jgi:hypothetical protein